MDKWNSIEYPKYAPLTWYKLVIPASVIQDLLTKGDSFEPSLVSVSQKKFVSFALKMSSMGKGRAWVNGQPIGRYWDVMSESFCRDCEYNGPFNEHKCVTKCGEPSQEYYHVPMDWILDARGLPRDVAIVLFEEKGGDPSGIELVALV